MASIRASQFTAKAVTRGIASALAVSQLTAKALINFPTEFIKASRLGGMLTVKREGPIKTSALSAKAIALGRVDSRVLRCWTFSLDGHDFYVLRLGGDATIVYDLTTGQWADWTSFGLRYWRAQVGFNWISLGGVGSSAGNSSNVVVGDDLFGLLWTLEPNQGYDDAPTLGRPIIKFNRKLIGGVPMRMRETQQVGAIYVTASMARPQLTGASVSLRTSDTYGKTWQDHGTIVVEPGNYDQEFVWRSIGLIRAPGRIFELNDDGATVRIDGMDMR